MRTLICVAAALLVSTLATPVREKREILDSEEVAKTIKILKDPKTYETLNEATEAYKKIMSIGVDEDKVEAAQRKNVKHTLRLLHKTDEGKQVMYELFKATLVDGAKPTEEQLTSLAKRLSKVVRESRLSNRNYGDKATSIMTNETIEQLKEIVEQTPLKESGNNYLDIWQEKIPKLYTLGKRLQAINRNMKIAIKTGDFAKLPKATPEEHEVVGKFFIEFFMDELIALLKSEETAIEIIKNFGIVTDTLKSASSYESLQALYNSLARSKRLEAHAILIREIGKCAGKALSPEEKAEWHQHFGNFLQTFKVLFADGQDISKFDEMVSNFKQNDAPVLTRITMKISLAIKTIQGKERFRQCLVTEEDRTAYKEAMDLPGPVYTEEQLKEIREKNEKVYAFVYLCNGVVKAVREREGLGPEADAYFKEVVTMPYFLLISAENFSPSQETLDKIAALKKTMVEKYNNVSGQAKKEFVDLFPYRSAINLALVD